MNITLRKHYPKTKIIDDNVVYTKNKKKLNIISRHT